MANYKEANLVGESYVRANSVNVTNAESNKFILFNEERVINLEGGEILRKPFGSVSSSFTPENANTEFQVLNPGTGEPIDGATMTYADVYAALYSLYLHLATERDEYVAAQEAAAAAAEEEPPAEEPPAEEPAPAE